MAALRSVVYDVVGLHRWSGAISSEVEASPRKAFNKSRRLASTPQCIFLGLPLNLVNVHAGHAPGSRRRICCQCHDGAWLPATSAACKNFSAFHVEILKCRKSQEESRL
ncbi:hypothetical protein BS78_02G135000 [Paspalum vaginatum]|nr:hypothetical protein BS78_02G135000 [Paspalum vaginatum]